MLKKIILLGSSLLILTACNNKNEVDKNNSDEVFETTTNTTMQNINDYNNVAVIKSADEADKLLEKDGDVFIYVSQKGCEYCDMVEPAMNEAIRDNKDLTIYHIDMSEFMPSKDFISKTNLDRTPWLIRMEDGLLKSTYLLNENTKAYEISLWLMS